MVDMRTLFKKTMEKKASDLHITKDSSPVLRIHGRLHVLTEFPPLSKEDTKSLIYSILNDTQKETFERDKELDFSIALPEMDRFRVNVHIQRGSVEAAFRRIPWTIPTMEEMGIPPILAELARKHNGLVLVTGATGMLSLIHI